MTAQITEATHGEAVTQFSIYADNKVGRLNELLLLLGSHDVHVMALCTLDTTDSTIIRLVVDYPDVAREILSENGYAYNRVEVVAVEFETEAHLTNITCALVEAEINIHYVYPFVKRPRGRGGLIIRAEDNDLATTILNDRGLRVLTQDDIAR